MLHRLIQDRISRTISLVVLLHRTGPFTLPINMKRWLYAVPNSVAERMKGHSWLECRNIHAEIAIYAVFDRVPVFQGQALQIICGWRRGNRDDEIGIGDRAGRAASLAGSAWSSFPEQLIQQADKR